VLWDMSALDRSSEAQKKAGAPHSIVVCGLPYPLLHHLHHPPHPDLQEPLGQPIATTKALPTSR
jgi:hypothetical protein